MPEFDPKLPYNDLPPLPPPEELIETKAILMMAYCNEETLRLTMEEGRTVFWSRSRQEIWRKGETSGERQWLREAYYDCDGDTLLFVVEQEGGGACHTGAYSCFYRAFGPAAE